MLILDTNHYSELIAETSAGLRLAARLADAAELTVITIVTAEETARGWLARLQPHRLTDGGVEAYQDFQESLEALSGWIVMAWTAAAAVRFSSMQREKVRVGRHDLMIAAIAMELGATVLTRNLVDFQKVPGLLVEN